MRLTEAFGLSFTQAEVDFVIPDLANDLPLAIDPFLLYKSRDENLRNLHSQMVSAFNHGIESFVAGSRDELDYLIDFPEVDEIGFGYSDRKIKGTGLGDHLNSLLADTLVASPDLQERGLEHIEELQLVSIGVGPDRISDIAGNALKSFLIDYTHEQATLWDIPLVSGLPVSHLFDFDAMEWRDDYFDLPQNPVSKLPIILIPRRIVRNLPWINYNDYVRSDFRTFLRASTPSQSRSRRTRAPKLPSKARVVEVTRQRLDLVDHYVNRKEREGENATPAIGAAAYPQEAEFQKGEQLIERIRNLPAGQATATAYQRLVFEVLNYLFEPELTAGQMEEATYQGTERRDIIYINESERSFLKYARERYGSQLILFEIKNVHAVEIDHINQVATYLGARLGMLGFIVTRNAPGQNIVLKTYSVYNDTPNMPRKTILVVTDADLVTMIRLRQEGGDSARVLQEMYRNFHTKVQ